MSRGEQRQGVLLGIYACCMYKFYMYINYIVIFNFLLYPFYGDLHSLSLECS